MRIVYVATYLPQHCGIATYTDYFIHGIRAVDPKLEVTIIAEKGASLVKENNFEVIPCWSRNEDYTDTIVSHALNFDAIHIQHEYSIYKFDNRLPTVFEKLKGKLKCVITIHCIRPAQFSERESVDEKYAQRIAQLADVVIVHLESQKAILERLGIPSSKINVIPHGSELSNADKRESRTRLGLPQDGKIILSFGFVKPHKCHHIMVEALKEIVENRIDAYLFIAGGLAPSAGKKERDYLEFTKRKIEELNLQSRVIFPNRFFPNEDVPYILGASDLVLFPYYEEDRSASGSFHLSIGARKPIIASRIPKFEELKNVSDELLILPYNSSGIAKIALRFFQDQEFEDYILKKTEEYRNKTAWVSVAKMHLEFYKK
jgi:glycosyltransferase involved in cell wall biosynthesis